MFISQNLPQKFELGQVLITPGARDDLDLKDVASCLVRHAGGDFGDVCEEDKMLNDESIVLGDGRIMSSYRDRNDIKFWIITEWDRSATTILLPDEY